MMTSSSSFIFKFRPNLIAFFSKDFSGNRYNFYLVRSIHIKVGKNDHLKIERNLKDKHSGSKCFM